MRKVYYIIDYELTDKKHEHPNVNLYENALEFNNALNEKIKGYKKYVKENDFKALKKVEIESQFGTSISFSEPTYLYVDTANQRDENLIWVEKGNPDNYVVLYYGFKRYGAPDAIDTLFFNLNDDEQGYIELDGGVEIHNSQELMDYMFSTLESNMQYDFGYAFDRSDTIAFCKAVVKRLEAEDND